jgi:hypothetical protein
VHQKDAQNERVWKLCIKKMHRMKGYGNCASKRCTGREDRKIYPRDNAKLEAFIYHGGIYVFF